ncbi:hypothetical protein [Comamonas koreensis]|uniref:Uncharacterized protein n=1 Tax=Comamonas koreensis TaxID=160825 RepID=A0AAW4XU56_9BURK|nr:hypothetical protein [Comamonas koreensis]MCD2164670.1 hypothetical protein [Comamonas koreensis]
MKLLARLLPGLVPKQKMQESGSGNVQAGHVNGDLHHKHTQVVNNNHISVQFNGDAEQLAAALVRAQTGQAISSKWSHQGTCNDRKPRSKPTEKQEAVLALLRKDELSARVTLAFMQREFKSTYVKALTDHQAKRVIGYVETVTRNEEAKAAKNEEIS